MGIKGTTILGTLSVILTGTIATLPARAASLRASCHIEDVAGDRLEGVNVDDRYPIASVSKIMTSYWAVAKMGVDGRFVTRVAVRKVSGDTYDLHLTGSRDPYFGKWAFQYLTSELNRLGITKIRQMTYDENLKFLVDTTGDIATAHLDNHEPGPDRVMRELRRAVEGIANGYDGMKSRATAVHGMSLPSSIRLSVEDIHFVSKDDFVSSQYDDTYIYRSAVVTELLKEMNRNSNNYAANNIFESLGGPEKFRVFIKDRLGLDSSSIRFVNGSGDSKATADGKVYNEATCRAIITVLQALRTELKKSGLGLHQVLAVAGRSANGTRSTVDMYKNDETEGALIAKTGTVNPAITLAGMMTTEEGNIYFGYIYKTNGSGADWRTARQKIKVAITALFREHGGGQALSSRPEAFLAFDGTSKLTRAERMN